MRTLFYSILLIISAKSMAQQHSPSYPYKPVVVFVHPAEYRLQAVQSLRALDEATRAKYYFLMLSDSSMTRASIAKEVNDFLNDEEPVEKIDKQRIYYLEWSETPRSFFDANEKNIFANYHFYQIRENGRTFNIQGAMAEFERTYLWQIALVQLEERSQLLNPQLKKVNFGLTYGLSTQNTFTADTAYLPSSINKLGFTVGYRVSPRFYLTGRGLFSFKIPNQKKMQSDMQSRINPMAGGSQTLKIEMAMHIYIQGSLQATYFFNPGKQMQPFVGAGVSFLTFQSAKISREVTIDMSSMMSGGGMPSGGLGDLGGGLDPGSMDMFKAAAIEPFGVLGLSYQLSRNTRFLFTTEYQYNNLRKISGADINSRSLNVSFNAGLQFELNKKHKKYYQYLSSRP
jgi:hypothetical protein